MSKGLFLYASLLHHYSFFFCPVLTLFLLFLHGISLPRVKCTKADCVQLIYIKTGFVDMGTLWIFTETMDFGETIKRVAFP